MTRCHRCRPGGGSATTTSYLWCGSALCQARNASNTTTPSYYGEGELVPGTPNQPYYYGIDQIGSVRRAFASTSSAPAYGYDAYGAPLQATAPVTDFIYGGMFYNADSGLYLTNYRAYDPVAGRWLSRDPLGGMTDPSANLYPYVGGNGCFHGRTMDVRRSAFSRVQENARLSSSTSASVSRRDRADAFSRT
jgi:RHS repeat-associated protein